MFKAVTINIPAFSFLLVLNFSPTLNWTVNKVLSVPSSLISKHFIVGGKPSGQEASFSEPRVLFSDSF